MTYLRAHRTLLVTAFLMFALIAFAAGNMQPSRLAATLLSGLTLGALYFMITSGLSLIFGLMDVLNFAHGVIFTFGAYVGFTLYSNPRTLFNLLPLLLALAAGLSLSPLTGPLLLRDSLALNTRRLLIGVLIIGALAIAAFGLADFPLSKLVAQTATATGGAVASALAQEPDEWMLRRALGLLLAGLVFSPVMPRRRGASQLRSAWLKVCVLAVLALVTLFTRTPLEGVVLALSTEVRFALALLVGASTGALLGATMEIGLIRPLYSRPIYQILLTLGLVSVGDQVVKFVWGPSGFFMDTPGLFNGQGKDCPSPNLIAWFSDHCASIDVLGRGFPSYRMFLIALGLVILVAIGLLLTRTRIGMIIRAGVQDSEMVEALGINVRQVFTGVFALGAALAALGGVAAAPIVGVNPGIGQEFLLQGFISVVIGGMGSLSGAAIGSLLVGLGRAFGDNIVLSGIQLPWMQEAVSASPAIARASTVIIMAIILLLKPSGIFGKKD